MHTTVLALIEVSLLSVSPVWIPIIAIVGAFAVGIVAMVERSKNLERNHRERMFLAEKGLEIPKELYGVQQQKQEARRGDYRTLRVWLIVLGVASIVVGVSVLVGVSIQTGIRDGMGGIFPLFIGIGFLISERAILHRVVKESEN